MSDPKIGVAYDFTIGLVDTSSPGMFKTNPTITTGDFTISKDHGSFTNLGTLPDVVPAAGVSVRVQLSSSEMTVTSQVDVRGHDPDGEWDDVLITLQPTVVTVDDLLRSGDITQYESIANTFLDLADTVESGLTFRHALKLMSAALFGLAAGFPGSADVYKSTDIVASVVQGTKDRIQAITDQDGNRLAITVDLT